MTDLFSSPKRRLRNAKSDIAKFDRRRVKFFNKHPYARVTEPDPDGIHDLHKIKLIRPLPESLTDSACGAIEHLRSALDQATYAVAVACKAKKLHLVHFPVADTAADFENALAGNCKELPPDIRTLLSGFQPYKGGNDVIWALNRIRRQSYHRLLVPVGVATSQTVLKGATVYSANSEVEFFTPPIWNGEKNEFVILRASRGIKMDYKLAFSFFIAFGDVEAFAGERVPNFLKAATAEAERIVNAIEDETRRLGLI